MKKPVDPALEIPKSVTLVREERKETVKKHSLTIAIPAFWVDKYGYVMACLDGKTTINICPANHSYNGGTKAPKIETYDHVCSSVVAIDSKPITFQRFNDELEKVQRYINGLFKLEIYLRCNVTEKVLRT